jgi:arylsulfatase A-like enzyme
MNRPAFLFAFLFAVLFAIAHLPLFAAESTLPRPNIVVFISDDHGMLDSEPYGASDIRTPNMTRLAAEGLKFTHAFVASPACGPSRTALLTGLWPARSGAERNHMPKRAEVPSLPTVLRALGYEVAAFGKVAHNDWAKFYDLDVAVGPNVGITGTADVGKYLATRDRAKPLCLFVGTRHPHAPWSEPDNYHPAALRLPPTHVDTSVTREMRAKYSTDVTKADTLLGELRALTQKHVPGDTLFVYTGDNGAQWPFAKWDLYDAGIRVPLILAWPGHVKPAATTDAMVCWPDLLPTFIELAGGKVPAGLDGRSFAAVLRGTATTHRDRIFTTHSGDGDFNVYPIRSLRTREWKYIRNLHPEFQHHTHVSRAEGSGGIVYWRSWLEEAKINPVAAATVKRFIERPAEELYDLKADPFELRNLAYPEPGRRAAAPKHAARLAAMRTDLDAWMKEQGDTQTVFGKPLLRGEPVTMIVPAAGKKKQP